MVSVGFDYVIYVDILLLLIAANFCCDYLLLWATAAVTLAKTTWRRIFLGAIVGTVHFLLLYLASLHVLPYYGILRFIPTLLGITLAMLLIAFYPVELRQLGNLLLHFLVIGCSSGGAGLATAYMLGTPMEPNTLAGLLVAITTILVIAELGWGVVQHRLLRQVYRLPLHIHFDSSHLRVIGLIDTGNHLTDPLTGVPVIVLEQRMLANLLPRDLAHSIPELANGDMEALQRLVESSKWSSRFRVIPYSSLGEKNGLLIGFRPDAIALELSGHCVPTKDAIIALCNHQLDPAGEYRALVPAIALQGPLNTYVPPVPTPTALGGEQQ